MTVDEFWNGDPWLAIWYRRAYRERRNEENRRDWIQGMYFYNAVSVALGNGFRKKGAKPQSYLEEPLPVFPLNKEEREAKEAAENEKAMAVMKELIAKQRAEKAKERQNNAET